MALDKELREVADEVGRAKGGTWVYYAVVVAIGFAIGVMIGSFL